jgi:hypothetical protein
LFYSLDNAATFHVALPNQLKTQTGYYSSGSATHYRTLPVLAANSAHDYEHYGNMATYMRIKGIVPPSSEKAAAQTRSRFAAGNLGTGATSHFAPADYSPHSPGLAESQPTLRVNRDLASLR